MNSAVPSKIVLAGTSNLSLDERFSQIKAPKPIARQAKKFTKGSHAPRSNHRGSDFSHYQDNSMMYQSTGYGVNTHNGGGILEVPDSNFRTDQRVFHHRQPYVPIEHRLSVPQRIVPVQQQHQKPYVNYAQPPSRGFQKPYANNPRPSRSGSYYYNQSNNNNHNGYRNDNRSFHSQSQNRFNRVNRGGGVVKQSRSRQNFVTAKKSVEEMDRELDAYMDRPKHPRITI